MENFLHPIRIGNLTLKNPFIMGSMHLGFEGKTGVADRLATFYKRRFVGGVSLIVTGGISVNEVGRGSKHFFNIQDPVHANELKIMNHLLSGSGTMCAQLFHAGRYAADRACVAPSAIRAPIHRYIPRELSEEECWETARDFGKAAKIAVECGFGAVEIMASEGYLLNQFFSPVTNQRTDHFGGDPERRMNMTLEVLKEVKKNLPEGFPVIVRMSGIDLIPGCPSFDEVVVLAKRLKELGASALNIGIGWHESRIPTISQLVPRGAWARIAGRIKEKVTEIPIIASNRVNEPKAMEKIFGDKLADIISMARPFLADPDIIHKLTNKESDRINTCIACNQACLDHAFQEKSVSCIVNPEALNEDKYDYNKQIQKRKVVVVGSGPGGLEAARACAKLGHDVTLIEKASVIGGQLQIAAKIPGKSEFKETIRYFSNELPRLGVNIKLNTECTIDLIKTINPDQIIFATGVIPRSFQIPGLGLLPLGTYSEYLSGKFVPGKKVAVIGGGGIGVDVAHKLTEDADPTFSSYDEKYNIASYTDVRMQKHQAGREVAVFRRSGKHGAGLGPTTFWALKQELEAAGVQFFTGLDYQEITKEGIQVKFKNGESFLYPCDSIIVCAGQEKEDNLFHEYTNSFPGKKVFVIGGAKDAAGVDAKRAFLEGLEAAHAIK